jgi:hypothetical protein
MNGPAPSSFTADQLYYFVDDYCRDVGLMNRFWNDVSPTIYVTSNCPSSLPSQAARYDGAMTEVLQAIQLECQVPYLCGAAALHHTEIFRENLDAASRIADTLSMWLPVNDYTALHIRAGASLIDVGGPSKAVSWNDGYASNIPQRWIDGFRKSSYQQCQKNLALLSDSARVLSEIRHAAQDRLIVAHCCTQALHRDRFTNKSFFFQEVVDLFILARSRRIVAGMGGFSTLGK